MPYLKRVKERRRGLYVLHFFESGDYIVGYIGDFGSVGIPGAVIIDSNQRQVSPFVYHVVHGFFHAYAERDHYNYGAGADYNSENRQRGAHFSLQEIAPAHSEYITNFHYYSSLSGSYTVSAASDCAYV
jgi:hypothetical protein